MKYSLIVIIIVTMLWLFFYSINHFFLGQLNLSAHISFLYLPSAVRLLAVLIFKFNGVIGLFAGSLISNWHKGIDLNGMISLSLISAINPYVAMYLTQKCLDLKLDWGGLTARQLIWLSGIFAMVNTLIHTLYFHVKVMTQNLITEIVTMFLGDFFGALVLLYAVSLCLLLFRRKA